MGSIEVGDRVRIRYGETWPSPPGYRFDHAEGVVVKWVEYDEAMVDFKDFVYVHLEKAEGEGKAYVGSSLMFRTENLEKVS
jgi:hypothetical protein